MSPKPRILAVDDEVRGVELVNRILRKTAQVETATSGEEAWARCQEADFDLIISDQRMPGMSGVEFLSKVAARSPLTGRILLTGYAEAVDTVDAINQARVHAYLNKPCPPNHLLFTVQSVLERVDVLRENVRLTGLLDERGAAQGSWVPVDGLVDELGSTVERLRADAGELPERLAALVERLAELSDDLREAIGEKAGEKAGEKSGPA